MIPDFQSIMLPLLQSFKDDKNKSNTKLREDMVTHFKITEDDQREKIPSGKQFTYSNRIAWALSYLKMAELITSPVLRLVCNPRYSLKRSNTTTVSLIE